jgi:(R,R)-butanediol dehydrogenase/meso-butanediol dehydrogenase/diacetyl reductase
MMETMRAAVFRGPHDVRIEAVPYPGPPGEEEVIVAVSCCGLCGTDASLFKDEDERLVPLSRRHPDSGHRGPTIIGHEAVGTVVEAGRGVRDLSVGQRVVPGAGMWCGRCPLCAAGRSNICEHYYLLGVHANGLLAQYARVPAKMCVRVPQGCSESAAALGQPCAVALHALSRGAITPGQTVALFGVGGIGSLLLAVMRARGEQRVIAVDIAPARLQAARRLGAQDCIDAGERDPVTAIAALTGGHGVDVAIDATGSPASIVAALSSVRRGGTLLQVGIPFAVTPLALATAVQQEKQMLTTNGQVCDVDLPEALRLLAETDLAARIAPRLISMERVVPDGLGPLAGGEATAKIVVAVGQAGA